MIKGKKIWNLNVLRTLKSTENSKCPKTHGPRLLSHAASILNKHEIGTEDTESFAVSFVGYYYKALAEYELDNYRSALVDFENALFFDPHNSEIFYRIGLTYLKLKDFESCEKAFIDSLRYDNK